MESERTGSGALPGDVKVNEDSLHNVHKHRHQHNAPCPATREKEGTDLIVLHAWLKLSAYSFAQTRETVARLYIEFG